MRRGEKESTKVEKGKVEWWLREGREGERGSRPFDPPLLSVAELFAGKERTTRSEKQGRSAGRSRQTVQLS